MQSAYALVFATKWSVNQLLALVKVGGKGRLTDCERTRWAGETGEQRKQRHAANAAAEHARRAIENLQGWKKLRGRFVGGSFWNALAWGPVGNATQVILWKMLTLTL